VTTSNVVPAAEQPISGSMPALDPLNSFRAEMLRVMEVALRASCSHLRFVQPTVCTIATFWGDSMTVVLPEVVSDAIAMTGVYESDLTIAMINVLSPGMTVFDIGAHRGYFTLLASLMVGEHGQVHAFEPTPGTFELLKINSACRNNIVVQQRAVFSETKELMFHDFGLTAPAFNSIYEPRLSSEERSAIKTANVSVQAVSIDDYVRETGARPNFIKIDAESAELAILVGAKKTLQELRPAFTLETGDMDVNGVSSTRSVIDYALSFGYTAIEMKDGTLAPHQLKDRYAYGNLLFVANENVRR
jgi:FkbM family methyltransferase